jgi:hypothetical protein
MYRQEVVEALKVAKSSIFDLYRYYYSPLPYLYCHFPVVLFMITKSEEVGLFASQILSSESKVMDVGLKRPKPLVI